MESYLFIGVMLYISFIITGGFHEDLLVNVVTMICWVIWYPFIIVGLIFYGLRKRL